jgi:DNA invertase Pin-like site-specific DNA recombinase
VDHDFSGAIIKRSTFSEMMTAAQRRDFDIPLVWKLDRFGRNLTDLVNTLEDLNALSIDFVSDRDNNLDTTTSTGKLVFYIMAAAAEFERDIISERIIAGLDNAKRKGKN